MGQAVELLEVLQLNNKVEMPMLGLGLSHNGGFSGPTVAAALDMGVRLFDTAKRYGNETQVGRLLRQSTVEREKVFVTSKLWIDDMGRVEEACIESCRRLGLEYLDLYLVHFPGRPSSGQAMSS